MNRKLNDKHKIASRALLAALVVTGSCVVGMQDAHAWKETWIQWGKVGSTGLVNSTVQGAVLLNPTGNEDYSNPGSGSYDIGQGDGGIAIGYRATVPAQDGISIGHSAWMQGTAGNIQESVVIGVNSVDKANPFGYANGEPGGEFSSGQGVVVGPRSYTTSQATAVGNNVYAVGRSSIAIGSDDNQKYIDPVSAYDYAHYFKTVYNNIDPDGTTYGYDSNGHKVNDNTRYSPTMASGDGAIAIGSRSLSYAEGATSVGTLAFALEKGATAVGTQTRAEGVGAIAIGSHTSIFADNSVGTGNQVQVLKSGGMAYGYKAYVSGENAIAIGRDAYANVDMTGNGTISLSGTRTPTADVSIFKTLYTYDLEKASTAIANNDYIVGAPNNIDSEKFIDLLEKAASSDAIVAHSNVSVSGVDNVAAAAGSSTEPANNAIVIGSKSAAMGNNSIAVGRGAFATEKNTFAIGSYSYANQANAIAIGLGSRALGTSSLSVGVASATSGNQGVAIGVNAVNYGDNSSVLGATSEVMPNASGLSLVGAKSIMGGRDSVGFGNQINVMSSDTAVTSKSLAMGNNVAVARHTTDSISIGTGSGIGYLVVDPNDGYPKAKDENGASIDAPPNTSGHIPGPYVYYGTDDDNYLNVSNISNAMALGSGARVLARRGHDGETGNSAMAIGAGAVAWLDNSIALGYNSRTDYTKDELNQPAWKTPYAVATVTSAKTGVISVGSIGGERRVVNLAAGMKDTDAVNVSQLRQVYETMENELALQQNGGMNFMSISKTGGETGAFITDISKQENYEKYVGLERQYLQYKARQKYNGEIINQDVLDQLKTKMDKINQDSGGTFATDAAQLAGLDYSGAAETPNRQKFLEAIRTIDSAYDTDKAKNVTSLSSEEIAKAKQDSNYTNGQALAPDSIAFGYKATVDKTANGGVAIGTNSHTMSANSISLGNKSVAGALSDGTAVFSGESVKAANGVLSLGDTDLNRRIVHVAGGIDDQDAVNVKQLKALSSAIGLEPDQVNAIANRTGATPKTVLERIADKADTNLGNITVDGQNVAKDLARAAVVVTNGTNVTVDAAKDETQHTTTYTVNVSDDAIQNAVAPKLAGKANADASDLGDDNIQKWKTALGVGNGNLTYKANGTGNQTVAGNTGLNFTNGNNTTASVAADGVVKYDVNPNLTGIESITAKTGGAKITLGGDVAINNKKLTGIADGNIDDGSKDAVNGGQIKANYYDKGEVDSAVNAVKTKAVGTNGIQVDTADATSSTPKTYTISLESTLKNKIDNAADKNLSNLSEAGNTALATAAQKAVVVTDGTNTTVSSQLANGVKTYKVNISNDAIKGAVANDLANKANIDASNITKPDDKGKWRTALDVYSKAESDARRSIVAQGNGIKVTPSGDDAKTYTVALSDTTTASLAKADNAADKDLSNLTPAGKTALADAAQKAVVLKNGNNTTITSEVADGVKTYKVNVTAEAIQQAVGTSIGNKADKNADNLDENDVAAWKTKLGVGASSLSYKANGADGKTVSLTDGLNFKNGTNTTATIDESGVVKYSVNPALTEMTSITGTEGSSLTFNANDITVNDKKLTGLANGTIADNSKDAVTGGQIKANYYDKSEVDSAVNGAKTTVLGEGDISVTASGNGPKTYTVKLKTEAQTKLDNAISQADLAPYAKVDASNITEAADQQKWRTALNVYSKTESDARRSIVAQGDGITVTPSGDDAKTYTVALNGDTIASLAKADNAADKNLSNISPTGEKAVKKLAAQAVKLAEGTNTTVESATANDVVTYKVNVSDVAINKAVKPALDAKADKNAGNLSPEDVTAWKDKLGVGASDISYKANNEVAKKVSLTTGLDFKDGKNTTAVAGDNGAIHYDVNPALEDITSVSGNGTTASFTAEGVSLNNKKITGLQAGADDADAVNFGQLKATDKKADDAQTAADAAKEKANDNVGKITTNKENISDNKGKIKENTTNIEGNTTKINTNASDISDLKTSVGKGLNIDADSADTDVTAPTKMALGDTFKIAGDNKNISTKLMANNEVVVSLSDSPTFGNIKINDSNKITGLAKGVADTDAVNLSQIKPLATALNMSYADDGSVASPSYAVGGNNYHTVQDALNAINTTAGAAANGKITFRDGEETPNAKAVPLGGTINYVVGAESKNAMDVILTPGTSTFTFNMKENPEFRGTVKALNGFDANGNVVKNVATGVAGTDAVNLDQLNAKLAGYTANTTTLSLSAPMTYTVKKGGTGESIIVTKAKGFGGTGEPQFYNAKDIDPQTSAAKQGAVPMTEAELKTLKIATIGDDGTVSKPIRVRNVAPGDVSETSNDAVNGSQLKEVLNILGTDVDEHNNVEKPNWTIGKDTYTNFGDLIKGAITGKIGPVVLTDTDGNTVVRSTGGEFYKVSDVDAKTLKPNPGASPVANDKVILSTLNPVADAGKGTTTPVRFSNIADGVADHDAVNVSQLKALGIDPTASTDDIKPVVTYDSNDKENVTLGAPNKPVTVTNLKDGNLAENSKDAVTGGQLYTTNQNVKNLQTETAKGWKVAANAEAGKKVAFGDTVRFTTDSNLTLTRAYDDAKKEHTLNLALADKVSIGSVTINGTSGSSPDAGTITGLTNKTWNADSITSGRAATEDQLKAAVADINSATGNADKFSVKYAKGDNNEPNKDLINLGGQAYNSADKTGGTKITNVAAGEISKTSSDAVNGSQLNDTNTKLDTLNTAVTNGAWSLQANTEAVKKVALNDTVKMMNGKNIEIAIDNSTTGEHAVTVKTVDKPEFKGVTIADDASPANTISIDPATGIDMGGKKITNLGEGAVNDTSTDAVTGKQLNDIKKALDGTKAAVGTPANDSSDVRNGAKGLDGSDASNADAGPAGKDGLNGKDLNNKVNALRRGEAGPVVYTNAAGERLRKANDGKLYPFAKVDPVTGDVLDNAKPLDAEAMKTVKLSLVNKDGSTSGEDSATVLGNVAPGVEDTDAVNMSQLKDVKGKIFDTADDGVETLKKITFLGDNDTFKEYKKTLGEEVSITAGKPADTTAYSTTNLATKATADGISIMMNDKPVFKGVTISDGAASNPNEITISPTDGINMGDKKITGLAPGTEDKDAVNYAQLKEIKNTLSGNSDAVGTPGKDGADGRNGDKGLDGNTATKVGPAGQDGLNGKNVNEKVNALRRGEAGTVVYTNAAGDRLLKAKDGKIYKADQVNEDGTAKSGAEALSGDALKGVKLSLVNKDGLTNGTDSSTVLGNVAPGVAGTDAVNVNQLKDVTSKIFDTTDNGDGTTTSALKTITFAGNNKAFTEYKKTLGDTVSIIGKKVADEDKDDYSTTNVTTEASADGITIKLADKPVFKALKVSDGTTTISADPATGINMGGKKITNLEDGTVSDTSTDAVTGKQLNELKKALDGTNGERGIKGDLGTPGTDGTDGRNGSKGLDGNTADGSVGPAGKDGLNGVNVNDKVNALRRGEAGPVVYTDKDGNRLIKAKNGKLYKAVDVNKVTGEPINPDKALTGDDLKGVKLSLVNKDGSTMEPTVLSNIADGVADTDAVNVSQLKDVKGKIFDTGADGAETLKKITFLGDNTSFKDYKKTLGEEVSITAGNPTDKSAFSTTNLATEATANGISIMMSDKPVFKAVTITDGASPANTIAIDPTKGIDMGGKKITNLEDGDISANSKDAVTGAQLQKIKDELAKVGTTTSDNTDGRNGANGLDGAPSADGKVGPAGKDGLNGVNVNDKVNALRRGEAGPVVYTDKDGNRLVKANDGKLYPIADVDATTGAPTDPSKALSEDQLKTVKLSLVNKDGSTSGNNAATVLGNVAPGVDPTDAVNVSQLDKVKDLITGTNGIDGKVGNPGNDATDGRNGDKGLDGATAADGNVGPAGRDGLNGVNVNDKVNALRRGEAGPVVYTDADGKRLVKANDGKLYPADQVDPKTGNIKDGVTGTPVEGDDLNNVRLSLVNKDGSTNAPTILGNVADGVADNDAVNVKQLHGVTDDINTVKNGEAGIVVYTDADGNRVVKAKDGNYYKTADVNPDTNTVIGTPDPVAADKVKLSVVNTDGTTTTNAVLGNIADGVAAHDAVNVSQLKSVKDKIFDTDGGTETLKKITFLGDNASFKDYKKTLGEEVSITAGNPTDTSTYSTTNLATKATENGISIMMNDKPVFKGVTITDGAAPTANTISIDPTTGIDMGGKKITNLAPGVISDTSTDAVTGKQLNDLKTEVTNNVGKVGTPGKDAEDGRNGTKGLDGSTATDGKIGPAGKDGLNGVNVNDKVNALRRGEAGPVVYTDAAGNRLVKGEDGKLYPMDQVNLETGKLKDNAIPLTPEQMKTVKLSLVNKDGSTSGANAATVLGNVAPGVAETDAVNVSQLKEIETTLKDEIGSPSKDGDNGRNGSKDLDGTTVDKGDVGLAGKDGLNGVDVNDKVNALRRGEAGPVVYTNDKGERIVKANNGKFYKANDVDPKTGAPKPDTTPLTAAEAGMVKLSLVNSDGTTTAPTVLSNVKKGVAGTDAVNVDQLHSYTDQLFTKETGADGTVTESLKKITFAGNNTDDAGYAATLGDKISIVGSAKDASKTYSTKNVTTESTKTGIAIKFAEKPEFAGIKVTDDAKANTISIDPIKGIDMGSKKITNLAKGTDANDAVNVSQLNKVKGDVENSINTINNTIEKTIGNTANDAKDGRNGSKGLDGATSTDGKVGPAGKDGLNGVGINDKVNALRRGEAGPVVYTNALGERIVKAKDGKLYKASDVDAKTGLAKQDAIPLTDAEAKMVKLSLVNADGNTSNPSVLGNVAPGVANTDAVNVEQLHGYTNQIFTTVKDKDGKDVAKLKEITFVGDNKTAEGYKTTLGRGIAISGSKNITTETTAEGLQINLADKPNVSGLTVTNGTDKTVTINPDMIDMGGNKITKLAAGTADTDAVNVSQLNKVNAQAEANKAAIAANKADIATNKADIAANKADIAANKADIATNKADIAANKADIGTNKAGIATNKADIATNKADIATNKADIATNKGDIATNKADIGTNKANIKDANDKINNILNAVGNPKDDAVDGRNGAKGTDGSDVADKNVGAAGQDNLNGNTINDKVNALRRGEAGTVVYTDAMGNRLAKAKDGKIYKADQVGQDGMAKAGATALTGDALKTIKLSLVNNDGLTVPGKDGMNATVLGNVAMGKADTDAVNVKQLHDATRNAISYDSDAHDKITLGSKDKPVTISNVNDGKIAADSTEAVNGRQLYALAQGTQNAINGVQSQVAQVNSDMKSASALNAALSALKPLDYDPYQKWQVMAGIGHYEGKNGVALGLAYNHDEDLRFNGGVALGGTNGLMVNAGVSWRLGEDRHDRKVNPVAKRYEEGPISSTYVMQKEITELKAENKRIKDNYSSLAKDNAEMKKQIEFLMKQVKAK